MIKPAEHRVVTAEKLHGGIYIEFNDGRSAIYPAALLLASFAEAEEIVDTEELSDEEASHAGEAHEEEWVRETPR